MSQSVYDNSQYVNELFEIIDTKPTIVSPSNPIKFNNKQAPRIEFKDVCFTYPDNNNKVLDNFSLVIESGQKIAFVGENGSGKTTIIKLLARFYDVDSGEILITNKTVLIISHRFSTVRNADKIYVLKKGSIVEAGNHQQLMELKGDYVQFI